MPETLPTNGNSATTTEQPYRYRKFATAFSQAKHWQQLLSKMGDSPLTKPLELASCARAWLELEECKRKLKMKPLPKPVDVDKLKSSRRKKQSGPAWSETPPDSTSPSA